MKDTSINEAIRSLRTDTGLSQAQFAAYFHIPTCTLQDWEHNRRTPPAYVLYMMQELLKRDKTKESSLNKIASMSL